MSSLHEGVREEIRKRIADGTYLEGGAIPSAAQLSDEFGVSAITVKRALRDLQTSGLLTAVAGKGTFVKQQRRFLRELDVGMSSTEDARRHGQKLTMQLISITREMITDPSLRAFDKSGGIKFCIRKLACAGDLPIMYYVIYVSTTMPDSLVEEFGRSLTTDALKSINVAPTERRLVIDAAPASTYAQEAFSIPAGYPVLRRAYHQSTTNADIEIVGIIESPFDRLACSITLPIKRRAAEEPS
ncbi:GntR family transcriptional regulator, histidine utilization repressor [Bosea sp. CRIB-10]|uniref:GntR family transcriptional regulator n=1 Tax=Bosea sp. CRIB-10 TaxID=378404 RepID=UPI0008F144E9|nr:GntR family transcriptional regulator [Bosea sp. CRIB-10]SFD63514.1 GntR family transcriptional regulator, histidine utilization repressor [Bosea sp. CRIB-10]